jgi:Tfp pilus assembly protein PilF
MSAATDQQRHAGFGRRCARALLAVALLGVAGLGAFAGGRHLWAAYHLRAGRQALQARAYNLARQHLDRCLRVWPADMDVLLLRAQAARRAGAYADAERSCDDCQRLVGKSEALALERALLHAQQGDLDRVEGFLIAHVRDDQPEESVLVLEALTQGYLKTYRLVHAKHCIDRWLAYAPDDVLALFRRGQVKEFGGGIGEAADDYRQVLARAPDHADARRQLARALAAARHMDEAAEQYRLLLRQLPDDRAARLGLAKCCHDANQADEADQLLAGLVADDPNDYEALTERGRLALEREQLDQAEVWLRRAYALAPHVLDVNYSLYLCLQQHNKPAEARQFAERVETIKKDLARLSEVTQAITRSPRDASLRYEAGMIFLRSGQDVEGLRWLHSALAEDPAHRPTHAALADYYAKAGDHDQAAYHRNWVTPAPADKP